MDSSDQFRPPATARIKPPPVELLSVSTCSPNSETADVAKALPDSKSAVTRTPEGQRKLLYNVNDCPPWYLCLTLGMQHFLLMAEATVSVPYLLTPLMCMAENDPHRGYIASTSIFVSGIVTLMQSTFGVRLPIIQGSSHTFIGPIIAILATMPCPTAETMGNLSPLEKEEVWQERMRTVQGAICVAAALQIIIGSSGIISFSLRWITPLTITPTIALIGLSLLKVTAAKLASNWYISSMTMVLLILFSQYLGHIAIPWFICSKKGFSRTNIRLFQMFPVMLTLLISWLVCYLLTQFDVLGKNDPARTDLRLNMISESSWFFLPYPGQFGLPRITLAGVAGVITGVLSSVIESIGDYYACAKLADVSPPPKHAINRGIWMEGVGTVVAAMLGTGSATTSFSQNIAAIGITGVGSRRVIQYAAVLMIACGVIGKIGALFINIPEPIIGGIFVLVFSMITSVGLSSLQFVDLNSSRNLFVLGFSLFFGLIIPGWLEESGNENVINTSIPIIDETLYVLLRIPTFIGGITGFILDNTIPGTREERGLDQWESKLTKPSTSSVDHQEANDTYEFPWGMERLRKMRWLKWIPISPTFEGWDGLERKKSAVQEGEKKN